MNNCTSDCIDCQWKKTYSAETFLGTCEGLQTLALDHKSVLRIFHFTIDSFPKSMAMLGLGNPLGFKEPVRDRPVQLSCNHMRTCLKSESNNFYRVHFDPGSTREWLFQ